MVVAPLFLLVDTSANVSNNRTDTYTLSPE